MDTDKTILLSSAYLGPVQYFSCFLPGHRVLVEIHDHYTKQTFRNRCVILSANGPLSLVIPVVKNHGRKTFMKDVKIDYATNWQRLHLNGIISAYKSSAFFEFYFDSIEKFYLKKTKFLLDLNTEMTRVVLDELGLSTDFSFTDKYLPASEHVDDYRDVIHPKKDYTGSLNTGSGTYTQVFSERFGFVPGLSIIDLMFNAGPEALYILKAGTR